MSRPGALFRRLVVLLFSVLAGAAPLMSTSCQTNPVTGKQSLNFLDTGTELQLGVQAYQEALSQAPLSSDSQATDMVRRVGSRIAAAAKVDNPDIKDFQWEFNLIQDDKMVNAWCLPGGKVAVYTGILPVTQTEAGLATVLGHEIAHATAHHGAARISEGLLLQLGEQGLALAMENRDPTTTSVVMGAFGLGAQVGISLPFGRSQESDADRTGLIYMARAGYDPKEALEFWKRMESMSGGNGPPEFLSTHPSHGTRIKDLQEWQAKAEKEFHPGGIGDAAAIEQAAKAAPPPTPSSKPPASGTAPPPSALQGSNPKKK